MKKLTAAALLIIIIFTAQITYINYRLEQKLDNFENTQQNILTKVYSLERSTEQINQSVRQALQKQQLNLKSKHNFILTSNEQSSEKSEQLKSQGIN